MGDLVTNSSTICEKCEKSLRMGMVNARGFGQKPRDEMPLLLCAMVRIVVLSGCRWEAPPVSTKLSSTRSVACGVVGDLGKNQE